MADALYMLPVAVIRMSFGRWLVSMFRKPARICTQGRDYKLELKCSLLENKRKVIRLRILQD